jgi:hypothetical protein
MGKDGDGDAASYDVKCGALAPGKLLDTEDTLITRQFSGRSYGYSRHQLGNTIRKDSLSSDELLQTEHLYSQYPLRMSYLVSSGGFS